MRWWELRDGKEGVGNSWLALVIDKTSMQGDRVNGIAISSKVFEQSKDRDTGTIALYTRIPHRFGVFQRQKQITFPSLFPFFLLLMFLTLFILGGCPVDRWRNGSAFDSSDAAIERLSVQIRCGSSPLVFLEILRKCVDLGRESKPIDDDTLHSEGLINFGEVLCIGIWIGEDLGVVGRGATGVSRRLAGI